VFSVLSWLVFAFLLVGRLRRLAGARPSGAGYTGSLLLLWHTQARFVLEGAAPGELYEISGGAPVVLVVSGLAQCRSGNESAATPVARRGPRTWCNARLLGSFAAHRRLAGSDGRCTAAPNTAAPGLTCPRPDLAFTLSRPG
jgi:hypothetical protein